MKKITLSLASLSTLLLPVIALAQYTSAPPYGAVSDLGMLVTKIENFIWIIFGGIAVIMFVVAGILFLSAQGQPEKVQAARSAFIWGIAGVIVGVIAYSIMAIVVNFVG